MLTLIFFIDILIDMDRILHDDFLSNPLFMFQLYAKYVSRKHGISPDKAKVSSEIALIRYR